MIFSFIFIQNYSEIYTFINKKNITFIFPYFHSFSTSKRYQKQRKLTNSTTLEIFNQDRLEIQTSFPVNLTTKQGSGITITPFIFRTFEDEYRDLHHKFKEILNISITKNPEFICIYYSESARLHFIKKYFPDYLNYYKTLIPGAYRADLWRLLILYHYGGIYMDMGMKLLHPLKEFILADDQMVVAIDVDASAIINGFLAFCPKHPILKFMIDWVIDNIHR